VRIVADWGLSVTRVRSVGDGDFSRQCGNELKLHAQFEVQIQEHQKTDHDPQIDDQVDAPTDPGKKSKIAGVGREPHQIGRGGRGHQRKHADKGRAPSLLPGIEEDGHQQAGENDLCDHWCSLRE
jgi:hypothetical protein